MVRGLTTAGDLTCLMISHKFREVTAFADEVSVLRRGEYAGGGKVADLSTSDMAAMMIGEKELVRSAKRVETSGNVVLDVKGAKAPTAPLQDHRDRRLKVKAGEDRRIAGISGNGQMEVADARRPARAGGWRNPRQGYALQGHPHGRPQVQRPLPPEEPLKNACAPR